MEWFNKLDRTKLMLGVIALLMVGIYYSRALLSIGVVLLFANAILSPNVKDNFKRFWQNKAAVALTALFFLTVFSGLFSEDTDTWLSWVKIKLPYLLLPIGIASLPPLSKRQYYRLLYWFFAVSVFACVLVGANYLMDFETATEGYGYGRGMQTPIIYVRFSLYVAFATICGAFLWWERFVLRFKWERLLMGIGTIFLFFFLHVLAYRMGLFALYNVILASLVFYIYKKRKFLVGLVILLGMFALPFLAYQTLPSFQNKINYMRWDLQQYFKGEKNQMSSDNRRLVSIETGIEVARDNGWLFGAGIGDMRSEMERIYSQKYPNMDKRILPHNQWVWVLASMGVFGLLVFAFVVFYPLVYRRNYRFWLFVCFHIILLSSFIAEETIELQIGQSFYLVFVLLGIHYLNELKIEH